MQSAEDVRRFGDAAGLWVAVLPALSDWPGPTIPTAFLAPPFLTNEIAEYGGSVRIFMQMQICGAKSRARTVTRVSDLPDRALQGRMKSRGQARVRMRRRGAVRIVTRGHAAYALYNHWTGCSKQADRAETTRS